MTRGFQQVLAASTQPDDLAGKPYGEAMDFLAVSEFRVPVERRQALKGKLGRSYLRCKGKACMRLGPDR